MQHRDESSRRRRRRGRREQGVILILTALTSVALIMSAAVAVDVGAQRAKRSQFQAVADGAALLAIYQINNGYTYQQASNAVKAYALRNLGVASSAWNNCVDIKKLEVFAATDAASSNECISFRASTGPGVSNLARVKIPVQEWNPLFGMGLVQMRVSAVAGAEGAQGVCDEFDLAGCVTTTTTTTTLPPTTTTSPMPSCFYPNTETEPVYLYDLSWNDAGIDYRCFPPCPPGQTRDSWTTQLVNTPTPHYEGWYECSVIPPTSSSTTTTTTAGGGSSSSTSSSSSSSSTSSSSSSSTTTTTAPPTTTTTAPPPPPTSIEIEF